MDKVNVTQSAARRTKVVKEVACSNCGLYNLCQLVGLDDEDSTRLEAVVHRRKAIKNGEFLFHAGDAFKGIYSVKSGSFKTISYFNDGREQVIDFHLPGELIGLEAIDQAAYLYTVVALENASVCEMDLPAMEKMDRQFNEFQHNVMQALSRKVRLDKYQALLIGAQNADQRLAVFLHSMQARLQQHGFADTQFRLAMRKDIANYLGLALETVGRILKRFEQQGIIRVRGRQIEICDQQEILNLAGLQGYSHQNQLVSAS